jgi:hypothetical protein
MIDISKLDKAAVLAALYNNARPQGLGHLRHKPEDMTREQAQKLLERGTYFDYVQGRVLKVDLDTNILDPWLYDRDNGQRAAQRAIETLSEQPKSA